MGASATVAAQPHHDLLGKAGDDPPAVRGLPAVELGNRAGSGVAAEKPVALDENGSRAGACRGNGDRRSGNAAAADGDVKVECTGDGA